MISCQMINILLIKVDSSQIMNYLTKVTKKLVKMLTKYTVKVLIDWRDADKKVLNYIFIDKKLN